MLGKLPLQVQRSNSEVESIKRLQFMIKTCVYDENNKKTGSLWVSSKFIILRQNAAAASPAGGGNAHKDYIIINKVEWAHVMKSNGKAIILQAKQNILGAQGTGKRWKGGRRGWGRGWWRVEPGGGGWRLEKIKECAWVHTLFAD